MATKKRILTNEQIKLLTGQYNKVPLKTLADMLHLSVSNVMHHAHKLGLRKREKNASQEIKDYIRENYKTIPAKEIGEKFGLTGDYVNNLAHRLGVTKKRQQVILSEEQRDFLKKKYKKSTAKNLIKKLNVAITPNALYMQINRLKIRKKEWLSDEDKVFIKKKYKIKTVRQIAEILVTSYSTSFRYVYFYKKNKNWTKTEISIIKDTSLSHRQASEATGRTSAAVKAKRRQLGVVVNVSDINYYSKSEIEYIKNNRHLSNPELAKLMGRPVKGLTFKRQLLGLNPPDNTWSEKEVKFLLENYAKKEKKEIAAQLNRPVTAVICKAYELGITRRTDYWKTEEVNLLLENINLPNRELVLLFPNKSIEQISYKKSYVRAKLNERKDIGKNKIQKDIPYKFRTKLSAYIEYLKYMSVGDSFEYPNESNATMYAAMKYFPERLFKTTKMSNSARMIWRLR
jgi:hypothetical protein